ncbi:MAG: hypothetical protein AB8B71_08760 [Paracoccaceae bacterium]
MWFDASAALATLAPDTPPRVAEVAKVAAPQDLKPKTVRRSKPLATPQTPPTCALCHAADWTVSLTEEDGRNLHVTCWVRHNQENSIV